MAGLWVILLIAAGLRILVIYNSGDQLAQDPDSYSRLATNLSETGVYGFHRSPPTEFSNGGSSVVSTMRPTAFRPPLYPVLLSLGVGGETVSLAYIGALHVLLGLVTVALTYLAAQRLGLPAWIPAAAIACDPLLLRQSQLVMTETLAACLFALAVWIWLGLCMQLQQTDRPGARTRLTLIAGALGLTLGAAILARPTAAPWALLCCAAVILPFRSQTGTSIDWKSRCWAGLSMAGMTMVIVVPWMVRNSMTLGSPVWATTHGGYTLLLANNPLLFDHFEEQGPSRAWNASPFHAAWAQRWTSDESPLNEEYWQTLQEREPENRAPAGPTTEGEELADNELAYGAAKATIARRPGTFLLACLYRCGWFWAWWPYGQGSLLSLFLIGSWYASWTLLLLFAALRTPHRIFQLPWIALFALLFSLTAVHSVYWSNMRMRAPIMSSVYLIAGAAFVSNRTNGSRD